MSRLKPILGLLKTGPLHACPRPGHYPVAVKVLDVRGDGTVTLVPSGGG